MSPRRTRPRSRRPGGDAPERPLAPEIVVGGPPGWQVRAISAAGAVKNYLCPGCQHEIRAGTPHVVAWQAGADEGRRHWHRHCWERARRTGRYDG